MVGAECTEMVAELAMNLEATILAHPPMSEMVKEATEVAKRHPIHM